MLRTISGKAMMAQASAAPVQRKFSKQDQQQKAGHHRRQNQGKMDDAIEYGLSPEAAARQDQGNPDRKRQAGKHGDRRYAQAEKDRRPLRIAQNQPVQMPCPRPRRSDDRRSILWRLERPLLISGL
jgi:hypothetical protein